MSKKEEMEQLLLFMEGLLTATELDMRLFIDAGRAILDEEVLNVRDANDWIMNLLEFCQMKRSSI